MNIFFLHQDLTISAKWLLNKHIVKMPVESVQMLSTVYRKANGLPLTVGNKTIYVLDGEQVENGKIINPKCYSVTHAGHPCTIWTSQSKANYLRHVDYLRCMLDEYSKRYGRKHSAEEYFDTLSNVPNLPDIPLSDAPLCMPDQYKVYDGDRGLVEESYKRFYAGEKFYFAIWKNGFIPEWMYEYMSKVWDNNPERLLKVYKAKTIDNRILHYARELCYEHF